jgi:predicted glycosyltransferase
VRSEYDLPPDVAARLRYVGYVSQPCSDEARRDARAERGLDADTPWVVCSTGGGALGERLLAGYRAAADSLPHVAFDIVQGPRSAAAWPCATADSYSEGNIRWHREARHLPVLHAAASVVLCAAGYNSLVEAMSGGARIVCMPVQARAMDEQHIHAHRLARFYPLTVVTDLPALPAIVAREIAMAAEQGRASTVLALDGAAAIRQAVDRCVSRQAACALSPQ